MTPNRRQNRSRRSRPSRLPKEASMRRRSFRGLAIAFVCLLGAARVNAQTSGSINGTVTDNTGAVLPGVTVTTTSASQIGAQTSVTNEKGQYRFPSVAPGEYRVVYELTGFTKVMREGIRISIGFTAELNVQLQLASLQETVTVTGASPVIDV